MAASVCKAGLRCHIEGKDLKTWGSDFPASVVKTAASCSVQLMAGGKRIASGTLVWNNVVLCAAHSILNQSVKGIEVLLGHELTAPAPAGAENEHRDDKGRTLPEWSAGKTLATVAQATCVEKLEEDVLLDYAFLRIAWKKVQETSAGTRYVSLPRLPELPRAAGNIGKGEELLLVGHPWDASKEGEPTQASAGKVTLAIGPHHESLNGSEFSYAGFGASVGFSGGGVFNKKGEIVGVLLGSRAYDAATGAGGPCFVNLYLVGQRVELSKGLPPVRATSPRMRRWLGGGPPLLDHETKESAILRGP